MAYLDKVKKLLKQMRALLPSPLPVGNTEFQEWADSFSELYTLPTSNQDSIRFTLASIIMHLGHQDGYKSKFFFYLTIKAGAAKQVAGSVFYDIKQKQLDAQKAEAQKAADEAQQQAISAA